MALTDEEERKARRLLALADEIEQVGLDRRSRSHALSLLKYSIVLLVGFIGHMFVVSDGAISLKAWLREKTEYHDEQ